MSRLPMLGSIAIDLPLMGSIGTVLPSADTDKIEHVFELESSSWRDWTNALEARIPRLMQEAAVPGLSVVLIRDAKSYWRRGFGVRDAEARQPVDNDTAFEAASIANPFLPMWS